MLEICTAQQIHPDGLIPQLPTLLRGHALLWFRNNRHRWSTWQQFEADFRAFYFPLDYADDLEAQISRRLQRQDEPVSTYFTDLQTLIRRHGGMTPEQELRWLYRNMTPQLRQMVRPNDFWDVFTLSQRAREAEHLLQELRQTVTVNQSRQAASSALRNAEYTSACQHPGYPISNQAQPLEERRLDQMGPQPAAPRARELQQPVYAGEQ